MEKKRIIKNYHSQIAFLILMIAIIICLLMTTKPAYAAEIVASGECGAGNSVTWTLDDEGTLIISGTGEMYDYSSSNGTPWSAYRQDGSISTIVINNGVTSIGDYAFSEITSAKHVYFPQGLISIGKYAFGGCSGLTGNLELPDTITELGIGAFYECSGFKGNLVLPDGITELHRSVFYNCTGFNGELKLPKQLTRINTITESGTYINNFNAAGAFQGCSGLKGKLIIPDGVSSIGETSFEGCGFSEVVIPDSVECIEGAHYSSNVYSMDNGCFANCTNLTKVTLSSNLTLIGTRSFCGCTSLKEVNIPDSVSEMGEYVFASCSQLKRVRLSNSLKTLLANSFQYCTSLETIVIPGNVEEIGSECFWNCSNLKTVYINSGTKTINYESFRACSSLLKIVIPDSVEYIDKYAFRSPCYPVYYVIKNSYADNFFTGRKVYFGGEYPQVHSNYLGFKRDKVVMSVSDIIQLSDYLVTDVDDYDVTISDESLFMYDSGDIANLGAGTATLTVSCGNLSASMEMVATNDALVNPDSYYFSNNNIELEKGTIFVNPICQNPAVSMETEFKWKTDDSSVATIEDSVIKATGPGETKVYALSSDDDSVLAACSVKVTVPFYDIITIDDQGANRIQKGTSNKLLYYVFPFDSTETPDITFISSNTDIVTVDQEGSITGVENGIAMITILNDNISRVVTVEVYTPLEGITLNQSNIILRATETSELKVIYDPEDSTERDVVWTSNKESVATVDQNGLVTAHGKGIATITATTGEFTATCTIVCPNIPMTGISLPESAEIYYGQKYEPEITYIPYTTTDDKTAAWQSSDENVFTVTSDGAVNPVGLGTATLTATVGEFTATSEITVVKGVPIYEVPETVTADCNQALSEIVLPEGFAWTDPSQSVGAAGTKQFKAVFTPTDTDHYNVVEDIDILISVYHKFAEVWSFDESAHWHECACGETNSEEGHTYGEWVIITDPTCEEEGVKERICTVCGFAEEGTVEATGHDWYADYTVDTQPTCTEPGEKSIHCKTCGEKKPGSAEEITALGHAYADTIIEPTCSQRGYTLHVCGRCGHSYQDNETTAEGHTFGNWIVDTDSTCTSEGIQHRECTVCGYIETKGINKKEHTFATEYTIDKEPTCTTDGSKSYHCTAEGCTATTGSVVIPSAGHQYTEWAVVTAPTCTEAGLSEHECTVCHEKETLHLEPRGHVWLKTATVDVEPTCTEEGSESIHCAVCDAIKDGTIQTIPMVGHAWDEGTVTKAATCTEAGVMTYTCTNDPTHNKTEEIPALGHDLVKTDAVAATCEVSGNIEYWTCGNCGKIFSDAEGKTEISLADTVIAATGHAWDEGVVTTAPTCTEKGVRTYTCSNDPTHTRTEEIASTGHALTKTEAKTPTCEEPGNIEYWTCGNCGKLFSDSEGTTEITQADTVIAPTGHQHLVKTDAVAATCSAEGNIAYWTCEDCSKIFSDAEAATAITLAETVIPTDANAHEWNEWIVIKAATCTETGTKYHSCKNNALHIELAEIPAAGHVLKHVDANAATCEAEGTVEYWTCETCGETFADAEGASLITAAQIVVPAKGHAWDEGAVTKAPTCTETGVRTYTCANDPTHTKTEEIPALGHDMTKTAAVSATCEEAGNIEYWTCGTCGKLFSDAEGKTEINLTDTVVPATGHAWDEGTLTKAPTCTDTGIRTYTCTNDPAHTRTEEVPVLGHVMTKTEAVIATCEEAGNIEYWTCGNCGKIFSDAAGQTEIAQADTVVAPTGHQHLAKTDAVAATCSSEGNIEYWTCEDCGKLFSDAEATTAITLADTVLSADPSAHDWNEWLVLKAATCTEDGFRYHSCRHNSIHVEIETIAAIGHSWDEGMVTSAPTCTETGVMTYTCLNDPTHTRTEEIPATGHTLKHVDAVSAACEEPGNIEYWTCETCRECFSDAEGTTVIAQEDTVIAALGHDLIHVPAKAATTEEPGNIEYWYCNRCGKYFADEAATIEISQEDTIIPIIIPVTENTIIRLSGSSRYDTGIAAAEHIKAKAGLSKFTNIVIASGAGFPDALSASYLSYKKNAPVLLVGKDATSIGQITAYVNANLTADGTAFIVGGEGAVPEAVESGITIGTVKRVSGSDRFGTNIEVLKEAGVSGEDLLIASGIGYADALSASAAKRPILLVGKNLTDAQKTYLEENKANFSSNTYIVGGSGAVNEDVEAQVEGYLGDATRLAGGDRFATSVLVAQTFFTGDVSAMVIASGTNFPDGLSGGPVAIAYDAPLILVSDKIFDHATQLFVEKHMNKLIVMGGTGAVSKATAETIAAPATETE